MIALTVFNPKKSLFARIFLFFWLTLIIILFVIASVGRSLLIDPTVRPISIEQQRHFDMLVNQLNSSAETSISELTTDQLYKIAFEHLMPLIIVTSDRDVLYAAPPPARVDEGYLKLIADNSVAMQFETASSVLYGPFPMQISNSVSSLFIVQHRPLAWLFNAPGFFPGAVFVFILVFSAAICFILARTLTQPLKILRHGVESKSDLNNPSARFQLPKYATQDVKELADTLEFYQVQTQSFVARNEQLIADIAHEIRTPLTRQMLAINKLESDGNPSAIADAAHRAKEENNRVHEMLAVLLEYSRIREQQSPQLSSVELHDILIPLTEHIEMDCASRHKQFTVALGENTQIRCDEFLLNSAIENIARNAVKYAKETVAFEQSIVQNDDNKYVKLIVKDDGDGVATENLETIFDPFFRVDKARTRSDGGVGLGLSIAKRAIEFHSGKVFASHNQSSGLVVTVLFPVN